MKHVCRKQLSRENHFLKCLIEIIKPLITSFPQYGITKGLTMVLSRASTIYEKESISPHLKFYKVEDH